MPITLITGPARSGKTERLLGLYRRELAGGPPGVALWLAPTWRAVEEIRERLLTPDLTACFAPNLFTFARFAQAILDTSGLRQRAVDRSMKRELLRQLIDSSHRDGRLKYYAAIAETAGLLDMLFEFISELKRAEIWPEQFREACASGGTSDKDHDLCNLYEAYQSLLTRHELYDEEGLFWSARTRLVAGQRRPFERLRTVLVDGFTDFTKPEHEMLEALAGRVESLVITLPLEEEPRRDDLFAKPLRTLEELRTRHGELRMEVLGCLGQSESASVPQSATRWGTRTTTPIPSRQGLEPVAASPPHPQPLSRGRERGEVIWPAMAHVERNLFRDPRRATQPADPRGIQIVGTSGQLNELEWVADRVKRLLVLGDPDTGDAIQADEILVIFRSLGDTADLVREVFAERGIPAAIDAPEPLGRSVELSALVCLLRLHVEDWPFRQLLAVLGHNQFRPDWPEWRGGEAALAADRLIRHFQFPSGSIALVGRIERLAQREAAIPLSPLTSAGEGKKAIDSRTARKRLAMLAAPLLRRLQETLNRLPQRATACSWAVALGELATSTGLRGAESTDRDRVAWSRLMEVLRNVDRLADNLGEPRPELTAREICTRLVELLGRESLPPATGEAGRVRVLSAISARNLSAPYVFLAGLAEKSFPPAERDDRFYAEHECRRLIDAGLPLTGRRERSQQEMLLFYETVTRATRRVWLTYPALDRKAEPLSPSPYLAELEHCCDGILERLTVTELSPVPQGDELFCARDFRVKAVAEALAGQSARLASLCGVVEQSSATDPLPSLPGRGRGRVSRGVDPSDSPSPQPHLGRVAVATSPSEGEGASKATADNILAGLILTDARRHRDRYGAFEGMVLSEAAGRRLAAQFSPSRAWSISRLEQYALCPHQFFLEQVLRLEAPDELALEADRLQRGRLLHAVLADLHRRINARHGGPSSLSSMDNAEVAREVDEVLTTAVESIRAGEPLEAALLSIDRHLIAEWLGRYAEQYKQYEAGQVDCDTRPSPAYFEVSFGPAGGGDVQDEGAPAESTDALSTPKPYRIERAGETVLLSGRIDRIDLGQIAGRPVFNVIDYKSGGALAGASKSAGDSLVRLQLPLYALATQELLLGDRRAVPWQAGYWFVRESGFDPKTMFAFSKREGDAVLDSDDWQAFKDQVLDRVVSLVRGIRGGEFPMHSADPRCTGYCPFNTVCRVNQVRALEKTWQPPAVEGK